MKIRRAFTLIELLVVIAIIALLIGILLPALGEARRAGKNAVSFANLRSLGQMHALYAAETKDQFFNPFPYIAPNANPPVPNPANWAHIALQHQPGYTWSMMEGDTSRASEPFGFHWASLMMHWNDPTPAGLQSSVQFAPSDTTVLQRFKELATAGNVEDYIWDGSYFYSPTFWFNANRFNLPAFQPANLQNQKKNRMGDVTSPSAKVLCFERFDFNQKTRPSGVAGASRFAYFPQWNNPAATSRFVSTDGSTTQIKMNALYEITASTNPNTQQRLSLTPSSAWNMPQAILTAYDMANDSLENGSNGTTAWPGFFWYTKNGVRGRDINR